MKQTKGDELRSVVAGLGFNKIELVYDKKSQPLDPDGEELSVDYVRYVSADIVGIRSPGIDDDDDMSGVIDGTTRRHPIGAIQGWMMYFSAAEEAGYDIVYTADTAANVHAAAEFMQEMYVNRFEELDMEDTWHASNGLYVHEIYLGKEYRGKGLGEFVLQRFIDHHDRTSLFAVVTAPDGKYFQSKDGPATPGATEKVRKWCSRQGFKPIAGHREYYVKRGFDSHWNERTPKSPKKKNEASKSEQP